jgi:hypothetical protein
MGYAVLNFPTTITNVNLLQDIGNVITGNITSASSLAYCTTATSTVVNTLGQNWTQVANTTANTARGFSAPCVTNGKTKYVKIFASQSGSDSSTYTSAAFNSYNMPTGSSSGYNDTKLGATACGSIASSTSVITATNECSFSASSTWETYLKRHFFGIGPGNNGQVVLSWSSRHLLILGNNNGGTVINFFVEHPENGASTYASYAPFISYKIIPLCGDGFNDISFSDTSVNTAEIRTPVYYNMRSAGTTTWYPTVSRSQTPTNFPLQGTIWLNRMSTMYTYGSSGANYLLPLYFTYPHEGIPMTNLSSLSNVYFARAGIGSAGDALTINGDPYRIIPYGGNGTYGGATIASIVVPYQ